MQLIVSCAQFPQYQLHHCWKSSSNSTWRNLHNPPGKLSHLLNLTWFCCAYSYGTCFLFKGNADQISSYRMHRREFDLLCHPGGIKISFFQDLRVFRLSWLLSRNFWEMWMYVAKAQANIMKKRILIYTVKLVCLIHCQKNALEKSYGEALIYMLTLIICSQVRKKAMFYS